MPPYEESASEITRRLYTQLGYSPDDITKAMLAELGVYGLARRVLYGWVRDRVQHELSRQARSSRGTAASQASAADHERQHAEGSTLVRSQRITDSQPPSDPRLRFLDKHVPCPGAAGGMKLYRFFTVDDHESRAGVHQGNLDGAARRIAGHSWAVHEIQKYGVDVLDEIPAGLLADDLPDAGVTV